MNTPVGSYRQEYLFRK